MKVKRHNVSKVWKNEEINPNFAFWGVVLNEWFNPLSSQG